MTAPVTQDQHAAFAEELRKWWSFDDRQMNTHSWHSREDFIERRLPELLATVTTLQHADALAECVREREDYNGKHQVACMAVERLRDALILVEDWIERGRPSESLLPVIDTVRYALKSSAAVTALQRAAPDDTKTTLRLFREFVLMNATQWRLGANHNHPMWARVAGTLGDDNGTPMSSEEYQMVHSDAAAPIIADERGAK